MGIDGSKLETVCHIHLPEGVLAEEPCVPVTCEVKQPRGVKICQRLAGSDSVVQAAVFAPAASQIMRR
jgi:hypothetical protein